jgi:outer membrane protein
MNSILRLRTIALAGIIATFTLTACNNNKPATSSAAQPASANTGTASSGRIAYVNVDSLEAHYEFWKTKKKEMETHQANVEAELQRSAQQLQSDYANMQQKARAGTLSQTEGEAAQQRLAQMQQSLESRRTTLSDQLLKEQGDFSKELQSRIDAYLADYNKDGKYDYILSYSRASNILYANKSLDITADVLKGLNEAAPAAAAPAKTK